MWRCIGSSLNAANAAATARTTAVISAAEDEVSAAIAAQFSCHAQQFQALSGQAATFHPQFVQASRPDSYGAFNTGAVPFVQGPVYISNSPSGVGTTIFDEP